ncbi:hypothetical protein BH11ACT4_BH11ACT4_16580 [soil metagenome]
MALTKKEHAQIRRFLDGSNWMQLATSNDDHPRISHHWFAPDDDHNLYIFTRYTRTHSQELTLNPNVAGGIALPPFHGLGTRALGASFQGTANLAEGPELDDAWAHYRKRFPYVATRWSPAMMRDGSIDNRIYKITPSTFRIFDESLGIEGNVLEIDLA